MKNAIARFLRLSSLLAALCVLACFETEKEPRLAGGDDYPNGVKPLGKKAAQARADSADWNGFDSVPRNAPGLYDTVTVPDSVPDTTGAGQGGAAPKRTAGSALAKGSAADTCVPGGLLGTLCPIDTLVTQVIDTAKGTVAAIHTVVDSAGTLRKDSTVIVKADPSRPGSVAGVSRVVRTVASRDSSRLDVWTFADADGNGVLQPLPGAANRVAIEADATLPGGIRRVRTQVLAAGADLDFNSRGDNRLLAASAIALLGGDTVEIIRFRDADGDSAILDFSKEKNLVDISLERRFPAGNVLASVTQEIRIVAFRDSSGNHPVRFEERRAYRDGSLLHVAARGLGPDSAFRAGEEARWTETLYLPPGAAADSLERKVRAFRVRLGPVPGAFAANVLLGWNVEETRRAAHGHFGMDFLCGTPVADGRWSGDGDVIAWLVLPEGRLGFAGAATAAGMQGHVTGPDGEGRAILYDPAGDILPSRP